MASSTPKAAYRITTARLLFNALTDAARIACVMPPAASAPSAVATEPAKVYQAKTPVLARSLTACDSAACSIDRNGPTSFPLGLITPIVPAISRSQRLLVDANATPAAAISTAPAINIRRRPTRSACVEMASVTTVSPTSVSVSSSPVCDSLSPRPIR
jgi:hypothetical protein